MEPIKVDAYKTFPAIGQEITKVWTERVGGVKTKKSLSGYIVLYLGYDDTGKLIVKLLTPYGYEGLTTYYNLCKNFVWLGDHFDPLYYCVEE